MTPRKRICCVVEACSVGKVCTNPLLGTVCSASSPEMNSEYRKKTRDNTQAVAALNSQIRISESSDSEIEATREARRGTHRPGTAAHQSHLIPNQIFLLWYAEFVFNSFIFVENPSHCS